MSGARALIRVASSAEAAAADRAAIGNGIPSRALMQRAGAAVAAEIALRFPERLMHGVLVCAGPGNNGGDAWVVAAALAVAGVRVRVCEPVPAATSDAIAERGRAMGVAGVEVVPGVPDDASALHRGEQLVVDGLLGTGSSGAPRGAIGAAVLAMQAMRARGALVVAIDVPTGVDATSGETHQRARADVTFTFDSVKRGHLLARAACGRVVVLDIGLGDTPAAQGAEVPVPRLVSGAWVAHHVPTFAADAHKGTRRKLAIVGGGPGMSGAVVLAARAAWRSGIGMVKLVVAPDTLGDVRRAEPQSLTAAWPSDDADVERDIARWADVVAIGPGLGAGAAARTLVERVLRVWRGPVVLDADALNAFTGDVNAIAGLLATEPMRAAVLTPHPVEFGRLAGIAVDDVLARRFEVALPVARHVRAAVLLKGQPTIVTAPPGERLVVASGTPLLAAAGSGDVLTGMVATLLGQGTEPHIAAACAAWVHGRAASLAQRGRTRVRGLTLDDAMHELPRAWAPRSRPARYPVLHELAPVVA